MTTPEPEIDLPEIQMPGCDGCYALIDEVITNESFGYNFCRECEFEEAIQVIRCPNGHSLFEKREAERVMSARIGEMCLGGKK